jgi:tetratricopeptide (TPR) repeat protein
MSTVGYIYCVLLGACNFLIFRVIFTLGLKQALIENIQNASIRVGAFAGIVITFVGGVAHRTVGFDPDVSDPWAWVLVFGVPLILAFLSRQSLDPGWSNLQRGKALWQSLIPLPMGSIDPDGAQYSNHPKVESAIALINEAIEGARSSNIDPTKATANAAIAWQELGLLYRGINDFDEARRCFDKSLNVLNAVSQIESDNPRILQARRETLFRLAELEHVLGNHDKARLGYEESLQIDNVLGHDDPIGESTTRDLLSRL